MRHSSEACFFLLSHTMSIYGRNILSSRGSSMSGIRINRIEECRKQLRKLHYAEVALCLLRNIDNLVKIIFISLYSKSLNVDTTTVWLTFPSNRT
jgi:hypothetical protein